MKIGILTLHSQQNYGGVLQAYALKEALMSLGHEVVVFDKWFDEHNWLLYYNLTDRKLSTKLKCYYNLLFRRGKNRRALRTIRSIKFVKSLGLTPYHFTKWSEAPENLGVDLVVVGSDQVWNNVQWNDPAPFLLEDMNDRVPKAISYAASFGMKEIPKEKKDLYARGFKRFSAISCREKEGVELCRGLGYAATHVVDPTLLVDKSAWSKLVVDHKPAKPTLVCYLLAEEIEKVLPKLEAFACKNDADVKLIISELYPNTFKKYKGRVRICNDYGPREFVQAFHDATWVLTDSFHAVMFASIFDKNLRFLKPTTEKRKKMFARITEFAEGAIRGEVFSDDIDAALTSFESGARIGYVKEKIAADSERSFAWLKEAIDGREVGK